MFVTASLRCAAAGSLAFGKHVAEAERSSTVAALVELRGLSYAYKKIGVCPRYVFLIMVLTLVGSHMNIPLYSVPAQQTS